MDLPETLPWAQLRERLTRIFEASPRPEYCRNPDPCIQRVIRLRDIAEYTRIPRAELYRVRRGERSLKAEVQQTLSWFFFNLDRARIVKEKCPDGRWRIVAARPQGHPDAPHARAPTLTATVDFLTGRLAVGAKNPH